MHWIDWLFLLVPLGAVLFIGMKCRKYVKDVADFLTAGRVAGRYVIAVADGTAGLGLISVVAAFEQTYAAGWGFNFWGQLATLIGVVMTLTGFIIYRYRESRVMTLAQFFELRYSKGVRLAAGILAYLSGVINYAVFPAVGARFLLHYCNLPLEVSVFGLFTADTFGLLMFLALATALAIVFMGGQLTTMVTDCVQGIFAYFAYAALAVVVFFLFSFNQMGEALMNQEPGRSFLNPYDTHQMTDFNILLVVIGFFTMIYGRMTWQGNQGYNCAGENPHEQKMAGVLGFWRGGFQAVMVTLLVVAAYTFMHHPDFAEGASSVTAELTSRIDFGPGHEAVTDNIRNQMTVPVALRTLLPPAFTGIFCALMVFLMVSTDTTYLHSWGSIFIQDIVLPYRKKPFKPETQLKLLKISILAVAVFAWFFSYYFGQVTYIVMFFSITGSIFTAGAGSLIIGGFYWKKGTYQGAWAALAVGAVLSVAFFVVQNYWSGIYPVLNDHFPNALTAAGQALLSASDTIGICRWELTPTRFPFSGAELSAVAFLAAIVSYVSVSLATCKKPFNLDRLLHRGKYNLEHIEGDEAAEYAPGRETLKRKLYQLFVGVDAEYSKGDRILAWSVLLYTVYNFLFFLFQAAWSGMGQLGWFGLEPWSEQTWFNWWRYYNIPILLTVAGITTVWFTWGGIRDLRKLFRKLKTMKHDDSDDGRVTERID